MTLEISPDKVCVLHSSLVFLFQDNLWFVWLYLICLLFYLTGALLCKAQLYQAYMKGIPVPTNRGSVIPFKSWTGLGMSIKELYKQPFHYLTNLHLSQLDRMRVGAEDEDTPLDFIIHPVKAETSIWLTEEFHRQTASPHQLAKLWLNDPLYYMYIDP